MTALDPNSSSQQLITVSTPLSWEQAANLEIETTMAAPPNKTPTYCNRQTAVKVSKAALALITFATTTYFIVQESRESRNIVSLSLSSLFNGGAIAAFFHTLLPPPWRKKINAYVKAVSYETLFAFTQVYLNAPERIDRKLLVMPFIGAFGLLLTKDILTLTSMKKEDLPLSTYPPEDSVEPIATCGFNTRSQSRAFKMTLTAWVMAGIALTAVNFTWVNRTQNLEDDFGSIGIYQDLIALFTGGAIGYILAKVFDDIKEKQEKRYSTAMISHQIPLQLKILRVVKQAFVLFAPIIIGGLFSIPNLPNSASDYFTKLTIGGLCGSNELIAKREFENPRSRFHLISADSHSNTQACCTARNVNRLAMKYSFSTLFFFALFGYMIWGATQSSERGVYAIVTFLSTALLSFFLTDLATRHNAVQHPHNRLLNEIQFRLLFVAMSLAIFYQYLTTKVDIGDQQLNSASPQLYALSDGAWGLLGVNLGNNRAVSIQQGLANIVMMTTPPIALQELAKTFWGNLINNATNH